MPKKKMTLEELINELPNGLHDALLSSIDIDYSSKTITLKSEIWMGNLDSEDPDERESYRSATIKIYEFTNCIIESPGYSFDKACSIKIDAGTFPHPKLGETKKIFKNTLPGEKQYWIYLNNLNSFIYISAGEAQIEWNE